MSLQNINHIHINAEAKQMVVGAGATWGNIVKATCAHNLIFPVIISSGYVTVGGSISSNAMSRFSPVWGKEGRWVESFRIITADGVLRNCSRIEHTDLFYAAIGGFGYFGAITEVTYNLVAIPPNAKVKTIVTRKPTHTDLHKDLLGGDGKSKTVYSVFGVAGNHFRTMTCLTEYRTETRLKQMAPHRPYMFARLVTEFMVQWFPPVGKWFWNYAYFVYTALNQTYIDPIDEYTFFMDGNVLAKRRGKKLGMQFKAVQQTFIVPVSEEKLNRLLAETLRLTRINGMPPAMIDALYLPKDEEFLLSSSNGTGGYAVSMAFEALNHEKFERIKRTLEELSELTLAMDGRVHLTKNVLAKPGQVEEMYKKNLREFFAVKRKYDPGRLFSNDFIERIFPHYTS